MATIVVYGGGFQPFHIGHLSSYLQAKKAFPDATFYVAASNDVKQRPIPFKDKQFLAQQAGVVDPFVETKNPINPQEILAQYDPEKDVYIMVRSERDPVGYTRKDGTPAYYQPYVKGQPMAPFSKHGYVFVTKKQNFTVDGEEVFSGSQVRSMYGSADDAGRMKIIQQLYPKSKQQQMIKSLLDKYLASPQEPAAMPVKPNAINKLKNKALAEQIRKMRPLLKEASPATKLKFMILMKTAISESKETDYSDPSWDEKVKSVGQKAKQAQVLKSKGKEPQTRWNPVTKKYYVDFSDRGEKGVAEDWQKVNKSDKTDGMSTKAVSAYRKENPGSKLKTAVTKKPSELKKGSKDANRRKSFCARMSGMKKAHAGAKTKRDPDSPINKALRRWNCESVEELNQLVMLAEQHITSLKQGVEEAVEEEPGQRHRVAVKVTDPVTYNDVQKIVRVDASDKQDALDQVEAFYAKKGIYIVNIKYLGMVDQQGVAEDKDPCWDNYKQVGMKKKNGKSVPNCVPKSNVSESTDYLEEK
jgi:hypothetical protein